MTTSWTIESRVYYLGKYEEGVAHLVRAQRADDVLWARSLQAVYWWPAREGKEWPAAVFAAEPGTGTGEQADAWAQFESALQLDGRYRWEPLPSESLG